MRKSSQGLDAEDKTKSDRIELNQGETALISFFPFVFFWVWALALALALALAEPDEMGRPKE